MATVRATIPVKADVITWARESLGLTKEEAAESLKVSLELLNAWESGRTEPRVGELRRLARVYKRPLSVLLLPERPPTRPIPEDFRTIEGRPPKMLPQTLVAIREAQRIQEIAAELLEYDPTLLIVDVLGRYNIEDSAIDSAAVERAKAVVESADAFEAGG